MNITGRCCFRIIGDDLDFNQVNKLLEMQASKTIVKGQKLSKTIYASMTFWSYIMQISDNEKLCDTLKRLLKELLVKKQEIKSLSAKYTMGIDCFLESDYGQMGFDLDQECIHMLNEIGAPVDFHILSFGMVE